MIKLNDILRTCGIDPSDCAVILHTPREPNFRRLLPGIVGNQRALFETYQRTHKGNAAATLRNRNFAVSFVGLLDERSALAGVYRVETEGAPSAFWDTAREHVRVLSDDLGLDYKLRADYSVFNFSLTDHMSDLVGRLMISPRRTQNYVRLAENLDPEIVELSSISMFDPLPPAWRKWCMTGPELRVISPNQEARLREWRGIYLIVDETDGARYVGSAYGAENLLSRWRSHVRRDHGVTAQLRQRNPANFRFSILERVSPDTPIEEITALEQTWMHRLHTKRFGLNT